MSTISKKMMTMLVVLLVAGAVSAAEMVTLKLRKLDGTEVTKEVEKPQYGWLNYRPHAGRNDDVGPVVGTSHQPYHYPDL